MQNVTTTNSFVRPQHSSYQNTNWNFQSVSRLIWINEYTLRWCCHHYKTFFSTCSSTTVWQSCILLSIKIHCWVLYGSVKSNNGPLGTPLCRKKCTKRYPYAWVHKCFDNIVIMYHSYTQHILALLSSCCGKITFCLYERDVHLVPNNQQNEQLIQCTISMVLYIIFFINSIALIQTLLSVLWSTFFNTENQVSWWEGLFKKLKINVYLLS